MNDQTPPRSVLFVCTANQCRSPMAEALLKSLAAQRGVTDRWQIQSAGTWAEPGRPATQLAQLVMRQRNIDLSHHRSRPVDANLLTAAHVILVMTQHHQEALQAEFPEIQGKVLLLSQLIDRKFDIEDPFNGSVDDYELCATDLQNILTDGYGRLAEMIDRMVLTQR
ncbi:MAG TPA: low molecular weight protein arginine phosphatase [Anaerolineae bacterium]|nr:low molecular weight protein arginine phosphatase [Anaerolineae bacterium]